MQPTNCDLNCYIYILYYQSSLIIKKFIFQKTWLVNRYFELNLTYWRFQNPKCQIFTLNVMAIGDLRHKNVSKQTLLLAGVDAAQHNGKALIT